MNLSAKMGSIKEGFQGPFWVANFMELFERLAYYGQATILSVFLRDHLKFNEVEAGQLSSIFGGLIYMLPIFAGALADKFGFRKAFAFAFGILAIGYFLIGSTGMELFSGFYENFNTYWILTFILIFTAIGGSFIKPSVLGTVALTTSSEKKSLGYAIYYWLVNIGAAIGPLLAYFVRDSFGIQFVYLVSALSCALMFATTIFFFKEPEGNIGEKQDIGTVIKNLVVVLKNVKFISFLLIFSLYWLIFWQFFIVIPFYISDYISQDAPIEIIISMGAWTIICFQIPVNRLTKNIETSNAILIGFVLATLSWLMLFIVLPMTIGKSFNLTETYSIPWGVPIIMLGMLIFSLGEVTQAPRYYEYIADLAPKGQAALFQGYAFLPIAIAWFFGGTLGGWLYYSFAKDAGQVGIMFFILAGIGLLATLLMFLYNIILKKRG
ncbi:MAG TPA: MFS transporter [Ignavibacteriaceae bacterium]|nr:MFS transporter [Ignavibacteriaceae bacterium]